MPLHCSAVPFGTDKDFSGNHKTIEAFGLSCPCLWLVFTQLEKCIFRHISAILCEKIIFVIFVFDAFVYVHALQCFPYLDGSHNNSEGSYNTMRTLGLLLSLLLVGFYTFFLLQLLTVCVSRLSPMERFLTKSGSLLRKFWESIMSLLKTLGGLFCIFLFFENPRGWLVKVM